MCCGLLLDAQRSRWVKTAFVARGAYLRPRNSAHSCAREPLWDPRAPSADSKTEELGLMDRMDRTPRLSALESQHRLTQHTHHATREIKKNTFRYAKRHSAQPDMFWRTRHTKPEPKSTRVARLVWHLTYGEYKLDKTRKGGKLIQLFYNFRWPDSAL